MKIILIIDVLSPHMIAICKALAKKQSLTVHIQAQTEPHRKWNFQDFEDLNFKCKLLPGFHMHLGRKDTFPFHINYHVKRNIEQEAPDAVIIWGWSNPTSYFAARACRKLNIPLLPWSGATKNDSSIFRKIGAPAVRWFHRRCSAFLADGTAARELLEDHWRIASDKIFVVGLSVDNSFFISESKKAKSWKNYFHDSFKHEKTILYVGQLIERKGILDLLKAFHIVRKKHPDAHLIIAGNGKLRNKIQKAAENEQESHIHMLGYIPYNELPGLYSHSRIFCLPSRKEVWGLVINEAMACGTAVIASDVCGASRDLLIPGETGLTFKKGDYATLAGQINLLLENKQLYRTIAAAGLKQINTWNISRLEEKILEAVTYATETNQ